MSELWTRRGEGGLTPLVSAIFAGIQGGPQACQRVVLQNAIISGLDRLVPDNAATQFCNGMTANIALSCLGVVFTLLWLWWVYYSVKTLRKFEKTTQEDGQEVMIVREKVWQKSMARLLRRDEDDDVNGIKRIVTGGLIDLVEMESRRGSLSRGRSFTGGGRVPGQGFVRGATTPRPSHESSMTSLGGDIGETGMRNTSPVTYTTNTNTDTMSSGPLYEATPRGTNDIIQSIPGSSRADMPPPPYIGQPANEGTHNTTSSSGTGTGTGTGTTGSTSISHSNESPITHLSHLTSTSTNQRPLPLAPPQIERVVERKMDEMAGSTGTGVPGGVMDAFTATRLGLGPVISTSAQGHGGEKTLEGLVDRKLDSFTQSTSTSTSTPGPSGNGGGGETMEQLVDRKIAWAGETIPSSSGSGSGSGPRPYPHSVNPYPIIASTQPNQVPPRVPQDLHSQPRNPHPHPPPRIHPASYNAYKGKAAEAGFSIQNQSSPIISDSPIAMTMGTGTGSSSGEREMSLEEMIELKMASLRSKPHANRPGILEANSGGVQKKKKRKSGGKGKGKGRARAGSDPGPKLERFDETDEDESE